MKFLARGKFGRRAARRHAAFREHKAVLIASVWCTFCSTRSTVMPRSLMLRMMLKFSFTSRGDRPSEGSSISSSFGAHISPRPIDTIACSPPDMVPASCVRRSASRGKMSQDFGHARRVTLSERS